MSLERVGAFQVTAAHIDKTNHTLQDAGADGFEAFVLWTGIVEEEAFKVREVRVPVQTSYRRESGLCVVVEGNELHRLNLWLYENRRMLGVQIHSHPTEAYHSETDDAYPIVTMRGGLSIVVPDFGQRGVTGPGIAMYRLKGDGWRELKGAEARKLMVVSD